MLLTSTARSLLYDLRWILLMTATGLVSINVALTGFCPVGNVPHRLGLRGRLDSGRSEKWYVMQTDRWYLERKIYLRSGSMFRVVLTIGRADIRALPPGTYNAEVMLARRNLGAFVLQRL